MEQINMLTKCFGIISYFPNDEPLRTNRKKKFFELLKVLDTYFKLPIIIVAQNWREEDFDIEYSSPIYVFSNQKQLGVTGARIQLRQAFLRMCYDYIILLDDDSNITCTQESADEYLSILDAHPDMFGLFEDRSWHRLIAISKSMYEVMSYDYIKNLESIRGEIWEDVAFVHTYKKIYPNKWYIIQVDGLVETQLPSEKDKDSTWYKPEFKNLWNKTKKVIDAWTKSLQ